MRIAQSQLRLEWRDRTVRAPGSELAVPSKAAIATTAGIAGILGLALPVVLYDWFSAGHSALELPMAATAWVFGLSHFEQNGYLWGSILVGTLLMIGYGVLHGAVFSGFTDRFLPLETLPETIGAGLAWGFVSWLFFWYTLLPMARGGAPFHATGASLLSVFAASNVFGATLSVAPVWVFVVGFAVMGVATALAYRVARRR